jgi:hypothetical protein
MKVLDIHNELVSALLASGRPIRALAIGRVRSRRILRCLIVGNVSGGNQPLRANYGNFNMSHTMLIQRRAHGRWEG